MGVAIAIATCLAIAAPAHALKVKYEQTVNVVDADSVESVDALCPDGFNVTGGGAFSNGAFQETKIQDSYPIDGADNDSKPDDGWRATIWNTASTGRNSEVQAMCAKTKTKYASAVLGNGNGGKSAKCPNGTTASGGGIDVNATFGFPYDLIQSAPNSPRPDKWSIFVFGPGMAATGVTVHAVCVPDDGAKLKARMDTSEVPAGDQGFGGVLCKDSEKVVGVGADAATQQAALVAIFGVDNLADPDSKLDDGTTTTVDHFGVETVPSEAYAICAK